MIYDYAGNMDFLTPLATFIMAAGFVAFLFFIASNFQREKSYKYRKMVVDMYIVGTIKKLAKEDGLDLNEEFREFAKIVKKTELKEKELDRIVEEELNEKIATKSEKAIK